MQRREAIKLSTVGLGLSSAFLSGVMSGCKPSSTGINYQPLFLDESGFKYLSQFTEIMIPQTDTPGAKELGLCEWIDTIVNECYTKENQSKFKNALATLIKSKATLNSAEDLMSITNSNDKELIESYESLKGIVATAYHCNEYVATKLLNYDPIPGEYEPCIELNSVNGKAWTDG